MSSNFSLSSFSHRPLNAAGAQQNSPADTSPKIPGLFDDVQLSPSMGGFEFELSELDIEQISPPPLEKKDSFPDSVDVVDREDRFKKLCRQFSMQESDLGSFRAKLSRPYTTVGLYNDFDGRKKSVLRINEVFQEVFTKLQACDGFEGHLGAFFVARIGQLTQSFLISKKEASYLTTLAEQYGSRLQDLGPSEHEQPQGSSLNFGQDIKTLARVIGMAMTGVCNAMCSAHQLDSMIIKSHGRKERAGW